MINSKKLSEAIEAYKEYFPTAWKREKYKWEAVKCFQEHWDLEAPDFAGMLNDSLAKIKSLLSFIGYNPKNKIVHFTSFDPGAVKYMFAVLFDESQDLYSRMTHFIKIAEDLQHQYDPGARKKHDQDLKAISTYLWLRYPEKYYVYKPLCYQTVAYRFTDSGPIRRNTSPERIIETYELYDHIKIYLRKDAELTSLLSGVLSYGCYPDFELNTLMIDFSFFIERFYRKNYQMIRISPSVINDPMETYSTRSSTLPDYQPLNTNPQKWNPPVDKADATNPDYTDTDFLNEVYLDQDKLHTLKSLLRRKKNMILQGAPGVGKTYTAKRLAYALMGEKDDSRIRSIQFHQNYSYEDFVMGYRPKEEGFELQNGVFYQFCMTAANDPDRDYFFIIDEINRGNMSKIFGELLMLIENGYRGKKLTLAYNGTSFAVPENLYLIGMMNTADRSLAMIDYALRRRFSFFTLSSGFDSYGFKNYQSHLQNQTFDKLIETIKKLNNAILKDESLGEGFQIGHSYFCGQNICTNGWMKEVVHYDIIPMLEEYWFDDPQKLESWKNELNDLFNDER